MLTEILNQFDGEIKKYLSINNITTCFFPGVERFCDEFTPIKKTTNVLGYSVSIVHDFGIEDGRFIREINLCVVNRIKFLKVVTSFFEERSYDFLIVPTEEYENLMKILLVRRKEENERIIDFPIIGINLEDLKKETIDFLINDKFRDFCRSKNIKLKRGIVFEGPPGCGKSCSLAWLKNRALEHDIRFQSFTNPQDFMDQRGSIQDNTEKRIIVFEDFDAFLRERKETNNSPNQILSEILNLIDGIYDIKDIVYIFTTNYVNSFDSAFLRPGRVDKIFNFSLPSEPEIRAFFSAYIPEIKDQHDFLVKSLLKYKANPSYAVLKLICDSINIYFFNKNSYPDSDNYAEIINESLQNAEKGNLKKTEEFIL